LAVRFDRIGSGCYCDRLNFIIHPRGTNAYTYDPFTGNLSMLTAPDGVNLTFNYSGSLLAQETWSGPTTGGVTYTYDNDLDTATRRVNSGAAIAINHDADTFLTGVGDLTIISPFKLDHRFNFSR